MRTRTNRGTTVMLTVSVLLGWLAASCHFDNQAQAQNKPTATEVLPAWNDGPAKKAIIEFVARVTKEGSPDFVPVADPSRADHWQQPQDEVRAAGRQAGHRQTAGG